MAGFSRNELIAWMRQEPRTLNWGAILAFNRTDTNTVLLQEYIDRFSTGHFLPPVQGYVGDSSTVGQYISDYVMDYPRLSFEIADVENEIPDARLTMQVVGGTQVTFADIPGGREATRIEVVDPLNGPALTLKVHLVDAPATITSAGKVVMDLSRSSDFSLSYSDFEREQRLGGEFFQQLFEELDDSQRIMVISEIKKSDSSIKPATLKIRTQAAPGAKVRSADNYGDGAVVVFVAMEGENNGGNPGPDFKYLIPNDSGKDYSATILLGNRFLLETLGHELLDRSYIGFGAWKTIETTSKFWTMNPAGGHLTNRTYNFIFGPGDAEYKGFIKSPFIWDAQSNGEYMNFSIKDDAVDASYVRNITQWCNHAICVDNDYEVHSAGIYAMITAHVARGYVLNVASQVIEPGTAVVARSTFSSGPGEGVINDPFALEGYSSTRQQYDAVSQNDLTENFSQLLTHLPPVNTFALHSLLFKNNNVVLDDMALPGDMALFGRVGPSLTRFTLSPLQPLIGTGQTLQFNTLPAGQTGLTWKAENILGNTGDYGSINASTGLYKAPDSIKGAFLRVKVSASGGGYSSSALVSVVVNDITVSPLIQLCDGGHSRTVSAGTKGTGALTASLKTPANGGKLVESEKGKWVYTAPLELGDKAFVLEEIVIRNALTNKTQSAWVMATLADMGLTITRDKSVTLPAGQTKLIVKASTSVIPGDQVRWETLAGAGTVVDGIYTQPATLEQRFVLLLASWPPSPEVLPDLIFQGYLLLPLPLFDYPANPTPGLSFMTSDTANAGQ